MKQQRLGIVLYGIVLFCIVNVFFCFFFSQLRHVCVPAYAQDKSHSLLCRLVYSVYQTGWLKQNVPWNNRMYMLYCLVWYCILLHCIVKFCFILACLLVCTWRGPCSLVSSFLHFPTDVHHASFVAQYFDTWQESSYLLNKTFFFTVEEGYDLRYNEAVLPDPNMEYGMVSSFCFWVLQNNVIFYGEFILF